MLTCLKNAGHTGTAALCRLGSFKAKAVKLLTQRALQQEGITAGGAASSICFYSTEATPELLAELLSLKLDLAVIALPDKINIASPDDCESHRTIAYPSFSKQASPRNIGDGGRRPRLGDRSSESDGIRFPAGNMTEGASSKMTTVVDNFGAKVACFERAVGMAGLLASTDGILLPPHPLLSKT